MRYLVNLPVAGALLCGWMMVNLTILTTQPRGGDAGLGAAFAIVGTTFFFWILLAVVVIGCALAGAFAWIPAEGSGARFVLVLMSFGAIVVLSLLPVGIAMETAGRTTDARWSVATIWAARAVAVGLPVILLAYAAWLINAPEELRQSVPLRCIVLGATGILLAVAATVSVQELARWNRDAMENAAAERQQEDEKAIEHRRSFEALTDADTLLTWHGFTYHSSPDDIRLEALRRIALRANLEAELVAVLKSENHLWAAEGVRLVADLEFVPSAALADAVRQRLDRYAAGLRDGTKSITYDGDKRIDYYEQSRLREALAVSRRLAEASGVDLRPQIEAIRGAVSLYPKSETAGRFPGEAAAAARAVGAALARRRGAAQ
jgi:hypothetical protein